VDVKSRVGSGGVAEGCLGHGGSGQPSWDMGLAGSPPVSNFRNRNHNRFVPATWIAAHCSPVDIDGRADSRLMVSRQGSIFQINNGPACSMVAALCAHARAWPSCWMPSRLDHHDQARMSPPLAISLVWQYKQGLGHRQHCETTELICVVIDITRFMCELGNINRTISKSWRQRRRTPTMGKS